MNQRRVTPIRAFVVLLAGLSPTGGCGSGDQLPNEVSRALLIDGATLISPERGGEPRRASVRIEEGRIAWIGDVSAGPGPEANDTLDARGLFLVPGLIDSHVHVNHLIGLSDEQREALPWLADAYFRQLPRSYLYYGFTTLIDPDLSEAGRERFEAAPLAPRLYGCGHGIRYLDGYGPSLFPEETRYRIFPVWTFDEAQRDRLPAGVDPSLHTPEFLVSDAPSGSVCVKAYHEPGFGGAFDWPTPSTSLLARISAAAHEVRLPLMLHATGYESWEAGLEARTDILAHGIWHWPGPRLESQPPSEVVELIERVRSAGIFVQPTARVVLGERETFTWERLDDPRLRHVLPPDLLEWLATRDGRRAQRELEMLYDELMPDPDVGAMAYMEAFDDRTRRMLAALTQSHVPLIFGSDTPASDGIGNPPGLNGYLELLEWEAAGFPADLLLESLTLRNAVAFGLDDEIGSIEVGKRADLLLLGENPALGAKAYDSIRWVVLAGQVLARDGLSAEALASAPPVE